ncbi:MAG: xanthine dehydrogenase family protein subunit M, partial [Pseudomonadota bacterium]
VSVMSIAVNTRRGDPRVVFGNMAPGPTRSIGGERELARGPDAAAAACLEGLSPTDDPLATEWYRREVASVHLRRLLKEGGHG